MILHSVIYIFTSKTPLNEICDYISFSELKKQIGDAKSFIRHLRPEFLEDISESCEN